MRLFAAAFALLAAAAVAAKPPAPSDDPARALYRLRGVGACVAAHPPGRTYDPQDSHLLADCECAIDRFIAGRDVAGLPPIVPGEDKGLLDEPFARCRAERSGAAPSTFPAPPSATDAAPSETPAPPSAGRESPGFDPSAWFAAIRRLPHWAWVALPVLALLLFALRRRRRGRDDLLGPPSSMRRGGRPDDMLR